MKLPIGKLQKNNIDKIFSDSIKYHLDTYYATLSEYDPIHIYSHWRSIVRSIDELINIPGELSDEGERSLFLNLDFDFLDLNNLQKFKIVFDLLEKRFEKKVALRFQQLATMCKVIDASYESQGI